ncbi:MAG: hypothetical protein F7B95_01345 [Desulfurococcales archaeon]|nr:hypothetical protein [Desulfurococcales archaeon]
MPLHWILDRVLAIAGVPSDREELEEWVAEGIRAVLSLLNEADLPATWIDLTKVHEAIKSLGLELYAYPVPSRKAPPLDAALDMVKWIDSMISSNRPVVITCKRGWGRGGSVAASYMVYKGYAPEEALRLINDAAVSAGDRPIESREQQMLPYMVANAIRNHQK